MKTICFDLDGVLCSQVERDYAEAKPNREAIALVNDLYDRGYKIVIHTARFMGRCQNNPIEVYKKGYGFTCKQLEGWGVKYHELYMGKPRYDLSIDDRSVFFEPDWQKIKEEIVSSGTLSQR
ncbi:MAG TPA: phosphoheptose isomerase [Bdellovibrionota bacterium]|nr:phosphoheptose isomerase [Bdellovibrionota bacterium]